MAHQKQSFVKSGVCMSGGLKLLWSGPRNLKKKRLEKFFVHIIVPYHIWGLFCVPHVKMNFVPKCSVNPSVFFSKNWIVGPQKQTVVQSEIQNIWSQKLLQTVPRGQEKCIKNIWRCYIPHIEKRDIFMFHVRDLFFPFKILKGFWSKLFFFSETTFLGVC